MLRVIMIVVWALSAWAEPSQMSSFWAKFDQVIVNETGKTIRYTGEVWVSKPHNALWSYTKPITKKVYVNGQTLSIVEPQLEQAVIRKLDTEIDFLKILRSAKKINDTTYQASVQGVRYTLILDHDTLTSIRYKDEFGHRVSITFQDQVQNQPIEGSRFRVVIPQGYDIIRE